MPMRTATLLLLCGWAGSVLAGAPDRVRLDLQLSEDSDRARQQAYAADLLGPLPFGGEQAQWAIGGGYRHLDDTIGRESFRRARAHASFAPTEQTRVQTRAELLDGDEWSPIIGSASLGQRFSSRWSGEVSAERELVDTVTAVRARNLVTTWAGSVDYAPTPAWTVVVGATVQDLRDANERHGRSLRLVYAPAQADWNLQLRLRRIDSAFRGDGYFSPERLEDALFTGAYHLPVAGDRFLLTLRAGAGLQRIDRGGDEALYLAELRGRGWFTAHYGFEARAGCSNTGGFNAGPAGDGYRFCEGVLSLIAAW
jgi:hypothetical protein